MTQFFSIFTIFLRLGLTAFGGPAAHIGYFRTEFVENKTWLTDTRFGDLLAMCQFLPGPASSQLGFLIGREHGGWSGALAAFLGFTLPSAILMIGAGFGITWLAGAEALVAGLKITAFAIVLHAVLGMYNNFAATPSLSMIAVFAAIASLAFGAWSQIPVILLAALAGYTLTQAGTDNTTKTIIWPRSSLALLAIFAGTLLTSLAISGIFTDFYRTGALVFGGGHVVLPLLENVTATTIPRDDFLTGYGLAQALPGPLFTFAGFLGTYICGLWGGIIATIAVFLPGFLLAAAILPVWSTLTARAAIRPAIAGVNAGVTGILGAALYNPVFVSAITTTYAAAFGLLLFWLLAGRAWPAWLIALIGALGGAVLGTFGVL